MQQKIFEGTPQEANRYLKAHRFPASKRVMIYLDDEPAKVDQDQQKKATLAKLRESQVAASEALTERTHYEFTRNLRHDFQVNVDFLFEDVEAAGGISAEAANEMDENSKQFKEEFWLDK